MSAIAYAGINCDHPVQKMALQAAIQQYVMQLANEQKLLWSVEDGNPPFIDLVIKLPDAVALRDFAYALRLAHVQLHFDCSTKEEAAICAEYLQSADVNLAGAGG
jgi:hypothetical protein